MGDGESGTQGASERWSDDPLRGRRERRPLQVPASADQHARLEPCAAGCGGVRFQARKRTPNREHKWEQETKNLYGV
jgi:hypothetical protein